MATTLLAARTVQGEYRQAQAIPKYAIIMPLGRPTPFDALPVVSIIPNRL
jgi:hypothetical protein